MENKTNIIENETMFDEVLDKYLRNQLSENEEKKFLDALEYNPALKEKADAIARLMVGMKQENDAKEDIVINNLEHITESDLREMLQTITRKEETPKKKNMIAIRPAWWLTIAASIIVLLTVGINQYREYQYVTGLGNEYCETIKSEASSRGNDDRTDKELISLFKNVESGHNLSETSIRLKKLWTESCDTNYNDYTNHFVEISWWLTVCYLKDNERDKAIEILNKMQQSADLNATDSERIGRLLKDLYQ